MGKDSLKKEIDKELQGLILNNEIKSKIRSEYKDNTKVLRHHKSRNLVTSAAAICVLILIIFVIQTSLIEHSNFTIYAYASDGTSEPVSKNAIKLKSDLTPYFGMAMEPDNGESTATENYSLDLQCVGDKITKITYTILGEQEAERFDKLDTCNVWFAENIMMDGKQYDEFSFDNSLYPWVYRVNDMGDHQYLANSYLGTSYSIAYDSQTEKTYSIEFKVFQNDKKEWEANRITIQVLAELSDGSKVVKKIQINPIFTTLSNGVNHLELEVKEK